MRKLIDWKYAVAMVGVVLIFALGAGLSAVIPETASGHSGSGAISCEAVAFSYVDFANGANEVAETIKVDGATVHSGPFVFMGASGSHSVAISVPKDGATHLVEANSSWNTNGHVGSFSESATVKCGEPPTTTETTPPPGPRCPPGEGPFDGKDGQPGNEECCPDANGDQKCDEATPPSSPPTTTTTPGTTLPSSTVPAPATVPPTTTTETTPEPEQPSEGSSSPPVAPDEPGEPETIPPGASSVDEDRPTLPYTP